MTREGWQKNPDSNKMAELAHQTTVSVSTVWIIRRRLPMAFPSVGVAPLKSIISASAVFQRGMRP